MQLKLPPLTEAAFTTQVIGFAKLHRWRVARSRPARTARGWRTAVQGDGVGFPDLMLVRQRAIVAELKVGLRKLTIEQTDWIGAFQRTGITAYVWRPADWPQIERVLGR